ncbi:hypothetical protein BJY01DRAFT_261001 [Aspergillus pseudoustus]|uniref:Nucleoside phosphorylase domain-containing protein n=1 Tax=Aspergillus pseudoustus TaxID=1810923 RepID=A0ABR4ISC4_9EURO
MPVHIGHIDLLQEPRPQRIYFPTLEPPAIVLTEWTSRLCETCQSGYPPVGSACGQWPGVVQWDFGKAESEGFRRIGALNNLPGALLTALPKLEARHLFEGSRIQYHLDVVEKRGKKTAPKFTQCNQLDDPVDKHRQTRLQAVFEIIWVTILAVFAFLLGRWAYTPLYGNGQNVRKGSLREPDVHYGLIASGSQVVKDAKFRDSLNASLGEEVLCLEMEAVGITNNFPCLVIRGICDFADERKNKGWQEYAAGVAAAFAKELLEVVQPIELDRERPVKDVLDQVADAVLKTQKDTSEILDWLTLTDYDPQQTDHLRRRGPNTGQWLLSSAKYTHWVETAGQILFFMTAIAVDNLHHRLYQKQNLGIVYIYCSYRRQEEQTFQALLLRLLKQLIRQRPSPLQEILERYEGYRQRQAQPELSETVNDIHMLSSLYIRLFILVDALDEYQTANNCRTKFINELLGLQSQHKANILATSRFIDDVTEKFQHATMLEIRANPEDIGIFLAANMANLPAFFLEDKMTPRAMRNTLDDLQRRAQVKSGEERSLQLLSEAYDQALERINSQREGYRSLSQELQDALAVELDDAESDPTNRPEVGSIVSVCAGLVAVDEKSNVVRLVHYTTQEYVSHRSGDWLFDAGAQMAKICITYIRLTFRHNKHLPRNEHLLFRDITHLFEISFPGGELSQAGSLAYSTDIALQWCKHGDKEQRG